MTRKVCPFGTPRNVPIGLKFEKTGTPDNETVVGRLAMFGTASNQAKLHDGGAATEFIGVFGEQITTAGWDTSLSPPNRDTDLATDGESVTVVAAERFANLVLTASMTITAGDILYATALGVVDDGTGTGLLVGTAMEDVTTGVGVTAQILTKLVWRV